MIKAIKNLFTKNNVTTSGSLTQLASMEEFSQILRLAGGYQNLAKEGYVENCIVNTCIRRTAEAINSIPCKFMIDGEEVDPKTSDKLIKSIVMAFKDPNPDYDKELFFESVQSQIYINGETYVFIPEDALGNVSGFSYLRPDKVSKTQSSDDRIHSYLYTSGDKNMNFTRTTTTVDGLTEENGDNLLGRFNLVIYKTYNPVSEVTALSRLTSCALSIDGHNSALKHNNAVMQNAGKISGIVSFDNKDSGGGALPQEALSALAEKIKQQTTGSNKGQIVISNSPAKFEKFALTPQEMDFINGIVQRATDICNALDYPPYLLGFTGATFSNQAEAKLSLYENSAIPKANSLYSSIATFLNRKYDIDFSVELDLIKVPAMAPRFKEVNDSIIQQYEKNIINHNEVREELHHEKVTDGTGDLYFADFSKNPPQQEPLS
jgi:HK97 family phage portal protein